MGCIMIYIVLEDVHIGRMRTISKTFTLKDETLLCLGYIFLVITIITWGMMDVIYAFLEEKDYHDKGLS